MIVLSWNIQNGKGVDDVISLERIASTIREMCDPDVICLQEVARHLALNGDGFAPDQAEELSQLFPEFKLVFGPAVEANVCGSQTRWQFGNATLSRLPVLSVFNHPLPQPAECGIRHMPRQATEITVAGPEKPMRIVNTHLEFHSARQRMMQVERLRALQGEVISNAQTPPNSDDAGPYQLVSRPGDCVLCGDFNMETKFVEYAKMLAPHGDGTAVFEDAWKLTNGDAPHEPTCGIYDHVQWPDGAHCRDFFFVSPDIATTVTEVRVNTQTDASDHQPLMLQLGGAGAA